MRALISGVDPGLVHTGWVGMVFDTECKVLHIRTAAINGPDAAAVRGQHTQMAYHHAVFGSHKTHAFIEGYKPRSHFNTDARMTEAVRDMKAALTNSTVLLNTGVKKVIRQPLMELLQVWRFNTVTNHQDLRSAARIALLGMVKDDSLNRLLSDVVRDHIDHKPWDILNHV